MCVKIAAYVGTAGHLLSLLTQTKPKSLVQKPLDEEHETMLEIIFSVGLVSSEESRNITSSEIEERYIEWMQKGR